MFRHAFLALFLIVAVAADAGWEDRVTLRFYQGVTAYIDNPEGIAFEVGLDVGEWNQLENGPRELLVKINDPDGRSLAREVIPDDGIVGRAFLPETGGWDHEMWYYTLCYGRGSVPMIAWSTFSDPARVAALPKRSFTYQVAAGKPGIYRVLLVGSRDHVATLRIGSGLKSALAGHPMWLHGHSDVFDRSWVYVPRGTTALHLALAEHDQPQTRTIRVVAPDGAVLWSGMARGGFQQRQIDLEPAGKYDDQLLQVEVSAGDGAFMLHVQLQRKDVRLYRGSGGAPALFAPDPETAKALRGGAIYHDEQVFWHPFQVRLHEWLKAQPAESFIVRDTKGNVVEPSPGAKYGWGTAALVYKGLPEPGRFIPLNGGHEAPPLCDSLMFSYTAKADPNVLHAAARDLHQGLRMITVGDVPVIGGWTGNLGYVYGTYGWHYWRPAWRILRQSQAGDELKAIVREAFIACGDRLAFARGIERTNGNALSHIPMALHYCAAATEDPLIQELADVYLDRFANQGWGRGTGISKAGDCQEHFAHDFHYGSYIVANYRALLKDLPDPRFQAITDRIVDLYGYLYCDGAAAYPWNSRTKQPAGVGSGNSQALPGPPLTVSVHDADEWFAARRATYYLLTFHGRLAPAWLNHYFGTKMGYGGGAICQLTVPGYGPVLASTLQGKYGAGMQPYRWPNFHLHSLVGEMADGSPLVAADSEHHDARLTGNTVESSGEIRDRPVHVSRSYTYEPDRIRCSVSLRDTNYRAAYWGKGQSSTISEAWEMIPFVAGKGGTGTTVSLFAADGETLQPATDELLATQAVVIDRHGYGVKIELDQPRQVRLGKTNTVLISLTSGPCQPDKIAFAYTLLPYIGNPGSAGQIEEKVALPLPRADAAITLAELPEALAASPLMTIGDPATPVAQVRLGVVGDRLALDVTVTDTRVTRPPVPWEGSSFEIFACGVQSAAIGQVFLLPALAETAATALIAAKPKPKPAPEVQLLTTATETGYQLTALVPLANLGLPADTSELRLELQVGAVPAGGKLSYTTLFNSKLAYLNNQRYGLFSIGRQP